MSFAKTASARVALALAVAALGLAGCGGGSSEEAQRSAATTADSSAQAQGPEGGSGSSAGAGEAAQGSQSKAGKSSGSGTSSPAASPAQGQGQKRGPRVPQPKGEPTQAPTPAQIATATVADMTLRSPQILAAEGKPGRLAATYTCDGEGSWPELRWAGVPPETAELILYAMNVQPVEGKLFVDWALAGLDPSSEGIEAGKLPKGAIVGTNSFGKRGYEICPAGAGEIYMFAIYALPQSLKPEKGFDARELRHRILDVSGNVGLLPAVYERG